MPPPVKSPKWNVEVSGDAWFDPMYDVQMGEADVMPTPEIMLDENGQPYFVYPGQAQIQEPPKQQEPGAQAWAQMFGWQ
jgi:hypothetical protein